MKSRTQRHGCYPDRFPVPEDKIPWDIEFPEYQPPYFVSSLVLAQDCTTNTRGWADSEDLTKVKKAYQSYTRTVIFDNHGRPLNPMGRTGIAGRGLLGGWGANFAADPMVTRINPKTNQLEIIVIQRHDTLELALPGGMVDAGETAPQTLKREFKEEAGADLDMSAAKLIYRGYVDDPRSTDNAWIETTAMHLHLNPNISAKLKLRAGDDALAVKWLEVSRENLEELYANHYDLIIMALQKMVDDNFSFPRPVKFELARIL